MSRWRDKYRERDRERDYFLKVLKKEKKKHH